LTERLGDSGGVGFITNLTSELKRLDLRKPMANVPERILMWAVFSRAFCGRLLLGPADRPSRESDNNGDGDCC
jgi:hypothetical protein